MHERRAYGRAAALLALVAAFLLAFALPGAAFAGPDRERPIDTITVADVPAGGGEDCVDDPDLHPGTGLRECPRGFELVSLLPFAGGGVVVVLALLVGWYLLMRRRASRPFLPDEVVAGAGAAGGTASSSEWWTCRNCGSSNMVGTARCYKCGSWQR